VHFVVTQDGYAEKDLLISCQKVNLNKSSVIPADKTTKDANIYVKFNDVLFFLHSHLSS